MEDLGFLFKDPEPLIFFDNELCGPVKVCIFFLNPMHLSQAALANECPLFLPRLTFWTSPFDGCPKICRVQHKDTSERLIFHFRTMTNKDNLSSLFNKNFLKYVPNSIYKYLQKSKIQHNNKFRNFFLSTYVLVVFTIFLNCDCCLQFALQLLNKPVDPQVLSQFLKVCTQNNISWKSYRNHIGTSTPNWPKYDTFATYSQRWYWRCFALIALSYKMYSSLMIQNHF